jgi:hypothetical protein
VNPFPLIEAAAQPPERGKRIRQAFEVGSATAAFPGVTLLFEFQGTVAANALVSTSRVDHGAQLGTVTGLPLIAGNRLLLVNGSFLPYLATGNDAFA